MKKIRLGIVFALVFSLVCCLPALADEGMKLNINGKDLVVPTAYLENGTMMAPLDIVSKISGVSVQWVDDNQVAITGNNKTITLTIDSTQAVCKDQALSIPQAPVKMGAEVYVPLRFLASEFDFTVSWDQEKQTAVLDRVQTRDGLTAMDLLIKSNQACQEVNTYSMDGTMQINFNAVADGETMLDPSIDMTTTFEGSMQNQPMQVYMKQMMSVSGQKPSEDEAVQDMTMESYMTESKMYMKAPEQEWMVMDLPFPSDFLKQQQEIQSNPLKAAEQMQEMGLVFSFGDDVSIDGQDYYVVNAIIDQDKFQNVYQQTIKEVLATMDPDSIEASPGLEQMNKLFDESDINYFYTVYIDQTNLISSIVKLDCQMDFNINPRDFAPAEEAAKEDVPEKIAIKMLMNGTFNIKDLGKPFVAPDVSGATEFNPSAPSIDSPEN